MRDVIQLYFLETEITVVGFYQEVLRPFHLLSIIDHKEKADIIIKVEKNICHLHAFDHYQSINLPCHIETLIQKIKFLFYIKDEILNVHGITLDKNTLIHDEDIISLTSSERFMVQKIFQDGTPYIHKDILHDHLGAGASDVIYRFRKKITDYHLEFTLKEDYYHLEVDNNV